jgi:predicted ATP-dependent serine protease
MTRNMSPQDLDHLDQASEIPRKLLHASELGRLPKSKWLIEGVLPTNKLTELFGMPGQGKSFTNLDIALSVAQFGNVVYVAAEDAEDYDERITAWCAHHDASPGGLHFWPEPVNLFDQISLDGFLAEIQWLDPILIVLDPLANCMVGRNEALR